MNLFTGIDSAVKVFLLNQSNFFDLSFVLAVKGAALITSSISLKARSGVTGGRAQFSNYDKQITCMADMD